MDGDIADLSAHRDRKHRRALLAHGTADSIDQNLLMSNLLDAVELLVDAIDNVVAAQEIAPR